MGIIKNKLIIQMLTKFTKACLFIGVASAFGTHYDDCWEAGDKWVELEHDHGFIDGLCLKKKAYYKLISLLADEGAEFETGHEYVLNLTPRSEGGYQPPSGGSGGGY